MDKDITDKPFPELQNDRIIKSAFGEVVTPSPVWIMRQAGRYLPEYHTVRNKAGDFFTLCQSPEMAVEVTLQPIDRFNLDAAIIFCDILVIPQIMGMEVLMVKGKGPTFPEPLETPEDLEKLKTLEQIEVIEELDYLFKAITLARHRLEGRVPLIGFVGAPWTLMAYMIEGGGSKTFSKAKTWLYKYKEASHQLLQMLTDVVIEDLFLQAKHGAQLLKVFDSWAGELDKDTFIEFLLPSYKKISVTLKEKLQSELNINVPLIIFAKGNYYAIELIAKETTFDVIALDWKIEPDEAREIVSKHRNVCLQGNLDPCALYGEQDEIKEQVKRMLKKFENGPYICNLGHGMHPTHDPEKLGFYIDTVHELSVNNDEDSNNNNN
eukprot:TRINITY_DN5438_c0_g1_i1.p1 TRINITY_DN5438_c0_g1~~TRINITY_DN5438_c0_g1_i1.p1  ORF type:complete len:379 (+),score=144.89 TRINITY_DN5438_c0_g1_i1:55-1191(+)